MGRKYSKTNRATRRLSMGLTTQQQYDVLSARLMKGMLWIDSPDRTQEEVNKWSPEINKMFREATRLEREQRREANK